MAPFADVPRKTAGGVGASAETDWVGTGTIPRACSVGNDETGNWTGIALHTWDVPADGAVDAVAVVPEAGIDNIGVGMIDAGTPAKIVVVADSVLAVVVDVVEGGGTY